jgi:hypothetical protein
MDFFQKISVYLVVSDFEVMRQVTMEQLHTLGADKILTATNGVEALLILRKENVDLVLSDLNMPKMSGLELLKMIRADEHLCRLPFMMITSEFNRKIITEILDAGVTDILFKPYTSQLLATHIQKIISLQYPKADQFLSQASAMPMAQSVSSCPDLTLQNDSRPNILIVDDDIANRLLLLKIFNKNYHVRAVSGGEEALSICRSDTPPDLVLLDIMMPGIDGFQVARRMREYPSSENIPIIFVTAKSDKETLSQCLSLGAVDFVSKPIDLKIMWMRVRNFMNYVAMHKQLQAAYDDLLNLSRMLDVAYQTTRHDLH